MISTVAEQRDSAHVAVFGSSSGFEGALLLIPGQRKRAVDSAGARLDSAPRCSKPGQRASIPVFKPFPRVCALSRGSATVRPRFSAAGRAS